MLDALNSYKQLTIEFSFITNSLLACCRFDVGPFKKGV